VKPDEEEEKVDGYVNYSKLTPDPPVDAKFQSRKVLKEGRKGVRVFPLSRSETGRWSVQE